MNLNKMLKKLKGETVLMAIAAVVIGYAIYNYSNNKARLYDGMAAAGASAADVSSAPSGTPQPLQALGDNSGGFAIKQGQQGPIMNQQKVIDPAELLPRDENSEWAKLNPNGNGDLSNVNLLKSGYHIGINTVMSSLRNANLQLRSEPANPQMNVGPWNNTTISPDTNRRPLEIGSSQ